MTYINKKLSELKYKNLPAVGRDKELICHVMVKLVKLKIITSISSG